MAAQNADEDVETLDQIFGSFFKGKKKKKGLQTTTKPSIFTSGIYLRN